MLRQAGGRHTPPQSPDRSNPWTIYAVPQQTENVFTYTCKRTHTHMHKGKSAFSTDCLSMQPILVPFFFTGGENGQQPSRKKKVKVGFNSTLIFINRGIFCLEKIHPHSTARKLIKRKEKEKREKCLSLQISGFRLVGNYCLP